MEVYVLIASSGSWDSYHKFIIAIFDNKELAEKRREEYNASIAYDKDKYSPEEVERLSIIENEYDDKIDYETYTEPDYPEEVKEYREWINLGYQELGNSWIETFILNQMK